MTERLLLRELELIRAIREEGSLARAAKVLHRSQPTLSHHLSALEARFGTRIVERGPRGAALTEIGEVVAGHADEILGRLLVAEGELARHAEFGVVTLRIGAIPSVGATLLAQAMPRLVAGGLRIEIVEGEAPELVGLVRRRELHLALTSTVSGGAVGEFSGVESTLIHTDPLMAVLSRTHRLASGETIALGQLRDESWITARLESDPCHQLLVGACAEAGFEPEILYRVDSSELTEALIVSSGCVALLPQFQLAGLGPEVAVRPLLEVKLSREIWAVRLATIARPATDRVITELALVPSAADGRDSVR
jgi:DNA-binding transcriptional LysR family regulator